MEGRIEFPEIMNRDTGGKMLKEMIPEISDSEIIMN